MAQTYLTLILTLTLIPTFAQKVCFNPAKINMEWRLIENDHGTGFRAELKLINNSDCQFPAKAWKIYFNLRYHGYDLRSLNSDFVINHVSGELFCIQPSRTFRGLDQKNSLAIAYTGGGRVANYQDVPGGFFWVDETSKVAVDLQNPWVINSDSEKLPERLANKTYDRNSILRDIPQDQLPKVFPTPVSYREVKGSFSIDANITIVADDNFKAEGEYLLRELKKLGISGTSGTSVKEKSIVIRKDALPNEAYHLTVTTEKIVIEAGTGAGVFYGIQTLKSLFPPDSWNSSTQSHIDIPLVDIHDAPRYPVRALMVDVARNFTSKKEILRIVELMSLYKLNTLHLHLNDDEGWRLEIPGLPELTEVGAKRGYPFENNEQLHPSYGSGTDGSKSSGNGYYTRADYIDILQYAAQRHITVIPEIESPGHARAAIKAMEARYKKFIVQSNPEDAERFLLHDLKDQSVYLSNQGFRDNVMNVALPSTYRFIEKVIDEIMSMYQEAGTPLRIIHLAGDEVPNGAWERSPIVGNLMQNDASIKSVHDLWQYYFNRIKNLLRKKGLQLYGWQELVVGTQTEANGVHVIRPDMANENVMVDAWFNVEGNEDIPYKLANHGFKTVLACVDYFYLDLSYEDAFDEPGDGWVGFLDSDKTFSFIPENYYKNSTTDIRGNPRPKDFFRAKEKLDTRFKANIYGIKGALWGENLVGGSIAEYLLLPKLLAVSEKAWAPQPLWETASGETYEQLYNEAWSRFANTVGSRELCRLDDYNGGYLYRIPSPGAKIINDKIFINQQLPGFVIRYTTDGSEPGPASPIYKEPLLIKAPVRIKAFDSRGRASKMIVITKK